MSAHPRISVAEFPAQSPKVGKAVVVVFHCNTEQPLTGRLVRDDQQSPYVTIIELNDGRFVLDTECSYALQGGPLDVRPFAV